MVVASCSAGIRQGGRLSMSGLVFTACYRAPCRSSLALTMNMTDSRHTMNMIAFVVGLKKTALITIQMASCVA